MGEPTKRQIGDRGEEQAVKFLESNGLSVIERNYHSPHGEIDIIAVRNNWYHIIEVKARKNAEHGYPEEFVDGKKLNHVAETALYYFQENDLDVPWQIDVIAVLGSKPEILWIENVILD